MSHFTGPLLPDFAVPSAYDLRLDLDIVAGSFTGTVAVNVELLENSRFIVLNGLGLIVDEDATSFTPRESSEVVLNGGDLSANSTVSSSTEDPSPVKVIVIKCYEEKISLEFGSYLPKGQGVLKIKFNGVIDKETNGFFICCGDNEKMCARRCFPCWDEPVYKARFKVTMQVPLEFVALSNMPIMEENSEGNRKILSYQESPIMATYLLTMFVGPREPDSSQSTTEFLRLQEAIQQMLTLQRAIFSPGQYSPLNAKEIKEILLGDIVMNKETETISRVGREGDKLFLFPIDKAEKEELREDEVVVVSRPFFHGQPVCLLTDQKKLGVVCGIDMRVDLAISDGKTIAHRDIGTEKLERNRRFCVGDTVVRGSWFGTVQGVKLTLEVRLGNGKKITAPEAEPKCYEPIFKNAAESYLEEPYYVGQEVIDLVFDVPVRGIVTKHKVDRVEVEWIHCNSLTEEKKPAKSIFYREVERIHDPRATRAAWALGSRCLFEGQEFVIAGLRSTVKVKWQGGSVEDISSTELVESGEFFSGQFVAEKEGEGVGFVRFVADGIAWVKWVKEGKPELVPISELQPHPEHKFQISDVVADKSLGDRGFVIEMENGKLEVEWWLNNKITVVQPEEITRLCYFFGEDTSEEDEDENEDEGSSDDDTPSFILGPVAIASSGSVLLEPASSSSDEDEDDDDRW